jgi:response regulator RpfG family c-di-GMP phosphodiesterase
MSRVLVYCGFHHKPGISLPATGVRSAGVHMMAASDLRLLWSEVEWPLEPERMQKSAVEFHEVVHHIFKQTAVIPFRLLSVFEDERSLTAFAAEHAIAFVEDLGRLKNRVQMECVIFPTPSREPANLRSGTAYLQEKAVVLRSAEAFAQGVRDTLEHLSRDVRVREGKNGTRIFVLVERGREQEFRQAVSALAVPEHLSRRISGPWPAAEFLSERVRAPQIAGVK